MPGFLDPEEIIDDLNLEEDMIVADFGCGSGGWVLPLAQRLNEGVVYGIDILEEPLSVLQRKLKEKGLANVKLMESDVEKGTSVNEGKVDLVVMTNFLFQVEDKQSVFEEAARILAKKGRLLIVEWRPEANLGPREKVSPNEVRKWAEEFGFEMKKEFQAGLYHYGFIYENK